MHRDIRNACCYSFVNRLILLLIALRLLDVLWNRWNNTLNTLVLPVYAKPLEDATYLRTSGIIERSFFPNVTFILALPAYAYEF